MFVAGSRRLRLDDMEVVMSPDLVSLSDAVERLQRENLVLKRIGIGAVILITAALLMGQTRSTRTVEAESFLLKGSGGSIRAKIASNGGLTEFVLYNSSGQARVAIRSDEKGEGLEMRDDSGELRALVSVAVRERTQASPSSSQIAVLGSLARPGVVMDATRKVADVRIDDEGGHRVWAFSSLEKPQQHR
jgi:hypothetical protein